IAFLAGVSTDVLASKTTQVSSLLRAGCRQILVMTAVIIALLTGSFVLQLWRDGVSMRFHVYWPSLLLTLPAAYWLLGKDRSAFGRYEIWTAAWIGVLFVDLWALIWPSVAVRPEAAVLAPSACMQYLEKNGRDHGRVLDRDVPGGTGTPL